MLTKAFRHSLKIFLFSVIVAALLCISGYAAIFSIAFVIANKPLLFPLGGIVISILAGVLYVLVHSSKQQTSLHNAVLGGMTVGAITNLFWAYPLLDFIWERTLFFFITVLLGAIGSFVTINFQNSKLEL